MNDVKCELCGHWFYKHHEENDRITPTAREERTGRCEDCYKCVDQHFSDLVSDVQVPTLV